MKRPRCAGCGHDDRRVFQAMTDLSESSYSFRLLCRYCIDRLRATEKSGVSNQWPYTLVMKINAPEAWARKIKNQPTPEEAI